MPEVFERRTRKQRALRPSLRPSPLAVDALAWHSAIGGMILDDFEELLGGSGAQFDPDRTCGERREDRCRELSVLLRFARDAAGISSAQPPEADEERSPALISERGHNLGVTTSADSG